MNKKIHTDYLVIQTDQNPFAVLPFESVFIRLNLY